MTPADLAPLVQLLTDIKALLNDIGLLIIELSYYAMGAAFIFAFAKGFMTGQQR